MKPPERAIIHLIKFLLQELFVVTHFELISKTRSCVVSCTQDAVRYNLEALIGKKLGKRALHAIGLFTR